MLLEKLSHYLEKTYEVLPNAAQKLAAGGKQELEILFYVHASPHT